MSTPSGSGLLRALASCRRVLLLSLLGLSLLAAALWAQAPPLDALRPQIEGYLKQQLELKRLHLGELSWYWAGFLWLRSEHLDFATRDERLSYRDGSIAVRIPMLSLLRGSLAPDRMRLQGGHLSLQLASAGSREAAALHMPGDQLALEDVDLDWRYDGLAGHFSSMQLRMDGAHRHLRVQTPMLQLQARLDEDGLPHSLSLQCRHGDWLPEPVRRQSSGRPELQLRLHRLEPREWKIQASLRSEQEAVLMPGTIHSLPFQMISVEAQAAFQGFAPLQLQRLHVSEIRWQAGEDRIDGSGGWQEGQLHLEAESARLHLTRIWSALRPLGGAAWHQWLASMHEGTARNIRASMDIPWARPFEGLPFHNGMQGVAFRVAADVSGADIALGTGPDRLRQIDGHVEIDESSLRARIDESLLPHDLGRSSGTLTIPWDSLELQIRGHGQIELDRLLAWRGPPLTRDWQWRRSMTDASYSIHWRVSESEPRKATAQLQPMDAWELVVAGIPMRLRAGELLWDHQQGITARELQIAGERMQGTLSLRASADADGRWRFRSLQAQGEADLAKMAAHFQLPLSHPSGMFSVSLKLDQRWSGRLDLTRSRWDHLLGSSKAIGEPFSLSYQGELIERDSGNILSLSRIRTAGKALEASGQARIDRTGLRLTFERIHTASFDGSLDIRAPFGEAPWEMDVQADYLNRQALPQTLEHVHPDQTKPWALRARIRHFDWDDARMSGVHLQLASRSGSTGIFEASQVHTSRLDILDVNAMFALLGNGSIDLRRLQAEVEKQQLQMSARLLPEEGGGMRWKGFASISGDFGHLMQRAGLSEKFRSGQGHILFSGQGVVLREQPWWQGLDGRLRLRVDQGRILEGGTLTTLLSALSLADLPKLLVGKRKDLTGEGILFDRLQLEAIMSNQIISMHNLAMRSTAFDLAGHGSMDIEDATVDLYLIARPLQNLDAILARIPLLRDLLGGRAHSFYRKVYHMHGPLAHAKVEPVSPEEAGLAGPGLIEGLLSLPDRWFGSHRTDSP